MLFMQDRLLAYGTCLNPALMARLCPNAVPLGTCRLSDWALTFRGTATIEKSAGASVPCAIWQLGLDDGLALDTYHRWPEFYIKERFTATMDGESFYVLGYVMRPCGRNLKPPTDAYLQKVVKGYEAFGFDTAPLYTAAEERKERLWI